jgi:hypothetical protein
MMMYKKSEHNVADALQQIAVDVRRRTSGTQADEGRGGSFDQTPLLDGSAR